MANQYNEFLEQPSRNQSWRVALYIRLSKEDNEKGESYSVTSQREILLEYLKTHPEFELFDIYVDDKEYSYEINAYTGKIVSKEVEVLDSEDKAELERKSAAADTAATTTKASSTATTPETTSTAKEKIGIEKAKSIALADIGNNNAKMLKSEYDDGKYELEYYLDDVEYSYEINAYTGKIVDKDIEKMDAEDKAEVQAKEVSSASTTKTSSNETTSKKSTAAKSENKSTATEKIGTEKAKSIALADIGNSSAKLVDSEYDDGKYELEFYADGVEYSYEINAYTGKIVDKEVEADDND